MIGKSYKAAWSTLFSHFWVIVGLTLLSGVISSILTLLFGFTLGISMILSYLVNVAMQIIYVIFLNGGICKSSDLLMCFKDFKSAKHIFGGMAWKDLWIFLWALIPIVGIFIAIYKAYSYTLTPYILYYEKDVPAAEAINVSKERMQGHKWSLFWAQVIPEIIYLVLYAVLSALISAVGMTSVICGIIMVAFTIFASLMLPPFTGLVTAFYYKELSKEL